MRCVFESVCLAMGEVVLEALSRLGLFESLELPPAATRAYLQASLSVRLPVKRAHPSAAINDSTLLLHTCVARLKLLASPAYTNTNAHTGGRGALLAHQPVPHSHTRG